MCWQSIFMHHVYFENVSHITFKWYKYIYIYIIFIYWWNYHPMNLISFHFVMKVLLHMQRICWEVLKIAINYEYTFCYSNLHQIFSNFVWTLMYLKRSGPFNHTNIFLYVYIEAVLHDWLKWFQMCLMTKIIHNLLSWLKEKLYIWL
jgi:hypothetical protein